MSDAEKLYQKSLTFVPIEKPSRDEFPNYESYRSVVIDIDVENAEILRQKNRLENKSIELFERMCLSSQVPPEEKFNNLAAYYRLMPERASELIRRYIDMIPHLKKTSNFQPLISLLMLVCKSQVFNSQQRTVIAASLYNNSLFNVCYNAFTDIAFDDDAEYLWRVEACKYLFASDEYLHISTSQEVLVAILENQTIESDKRYDIIVSFITTRGVRTLTNAHSLPVVYNEPFVAGLQTIFFYNHENGVRQRILSGQHLLQMSEDVVCSTEKTKIAEHILDIAKDIDLDENTRADAADIILRVGSEEMKHIANEIIREIGTSSPGGNMRNKGTIMDATGTVYANTQNAHSFSEQTLKIMETLVVNTIANIEYTEIYDALIVLIKKYATDETGKIDNTIKFKAMKALNRVNQDTATFTKYNITLSNLIVLVWCRIESYDKETMSELKKRLVEELIDMGDTCSTGHADRFINVLSGYEFTLKVSWEEQISANIVGRLNALMRDCEDPDLKECLEVARTDLATEEEIARYDLFVKENLESIKYELYDEFVGGNHVSEEEFESHFQSGIAKLK